MFTLTNLFDHAMAPHRPFILTLCLIGLLATCSEADIVMDLFGSVSLTPINLDIDEVVDAANVGGILHVTGRDSNGVDQRQLINLSTGVKSTPGVFIGQTGNLNPTDFDTAIVRVVGLYDGRAMYMGLSTSPIVTASPTYWFDPSTPVSASATLSGIVRDVTPDGTYVGGEGNIATVGDIGSFFQPLPGNVAGVGRDITADASYIVGGGIWRQGAVGYEQVNTLGFDLPPGALSLPPTWDAVEIDPAGGDAVIVGAYTDATTFAPRIGFWRADGTFLFAAADGEVFSDIEVYEGQIIAALNGVDDGVLYYAITDGSSLTIEALTGSKHLFAGRGLYQGSAGLLLEGSGGAFTTAYQTIPEPSAFLFLAIVTAIAAVARIRLARARRN